MLENSQEWKEDWEIIIFHILQSRLSMNLMINNMLSYNQHHEIIQFYEIDICEWVLLMGWKSAHLFQKYKFLLAQRYIYISRKHFIMVYQTQATAFTNSELTKNKPWLSIT